MRISFLIIPSGITKNAKNIIISNSYMVNPVVLNSSPPKYINIIWTIEIIIKIRRNILFFNKLENIFILWVLELNARNISKNINSPKNAVSKYLFY